MLRSPGLSWREESEVRHRRRSREPRRSRSRSPEYCRVSLSPVGRSRSPVGRSRSPVGRGWDACELCRKPGHVTQQCDQLYCYRCNTQGHFAKVSFLKTIFLKATILQLFAYVIYVMYIIPLEFSSVGICSMCTDLFFLVYNFVVLCGGSVFRGVTPCGVCCILRSFHQTF